MPSEMTLYQRLTKANEAAIRREGLGELVPRMMVPVDDLAAIEADMLAPWRERVAALEYEIGEIIADWMVAARTYDAADRAGETQPVALSTQENPDGTIHEITYYPDGIALEPAAPSPTDGAADIAEEAHDAK